MSCAMSRAMSHAMSCAMSHAMSCAMGCAMRCEIECETRCARVALVALVVLALGCAGPEPVEPGWAEPLPYVIRVDVPRAARDEPGLLAVDRVRALGELSTRAAALGVSTELRFGTPETEVEPDIDLLLRVREEEPPTWSFAGRNGWSFLNTLLWFGLGFPSFYIADREYEVRWDLDVELSHPPSGAPPIVFRESLRRTVALDLLERGWTAAVLYTPPAFYDGPRIATALAPIAEDWLGERLLSAIARSHPGIRASGDLALRVADPRNFASVAAGETIIALEISSSAPLEVLRVALDGDEVLLLTRLDLPAPSGTRDDGSRVWTVAHPLELAPGTHRVRIEAASSAARATTTSFADARWSATQTIEIRAAE